MINYMQLNCGAIAVTASSTYMTIMELSANGCNLWPLKDNETIVTIVLISA